MTPERSAFIMLHHILGLSAQKIARRLGVEEREVEVLMSSELYQLNLANAIDAFRRKATRNAVDRLVFAAEDATEFLASLPDNMMHKPSIRLRAALEILDRIPETSKTLRQYVSHNVESGFTDEQVERMNSHRRFVEEPMEPEALPEGQREDLGKLIDVK